MQVYEKISSIRKIKGWSQEKVAEQLGMSANGYAKIERGETDVQLSRLQKIAEIFGIEIKDLFNLDGNQILNLASNQSHFNNYINPGNNQIELKHEIDKLHLIVEQKEKEIIYLKEIIELLKQPGKRTT